MSSGKHKLTIIDYYDSLVQRVDVFTEERLEIYSNDHLIEIKDVEKDEISEDLKAFDLDTATDLLSEKTEKIVFSPDLVKDKPLSDFAVKPNWPKKLPFSMGAQDYLNFMRDEMIKQIKIAEKDTLDYYETIRDELRKNVKIADEKELKRKLFAKRSAFLFSNRHSNLNPFSLYLVIFDFYLDIHQEALLKYLIFFYDQDKVLIIQNLGNRNFL